MDDYPILGDNETTLALLRFKNSIHTQSRQILALSLVLVLSLGFVSLSVPIIQEVNAAQGVVIVPVMWCVMEGSASLENTPTFPIQGASQVLMQRLDDASTNIYLPDADMIFRKEFQFTPQLVKGPPVLGGPGGVGPVVAAGPALLYGVKIIPDPDTSNPNAAEGDVLDPRIDDTEVGLAYNDCVSAWGNRAGLHVVNVNLFHNNNGDHILYSGRSTGCSSNNPNLNDGDPQKYLCNFSDGFRGHSTIIDDFYNNPNIPNTNRQLNTGQILLKDPYEWTFGHEVGHALGLVGEFYDYVDGHNMNPPDDALGDLMFSSGSSFVGGDSITNINMWKYDEFGSGSPDEYHQVRENAKVFSEEDPPNEIIRPDLVGKAIAANLSLSDNVPHYLKNSIMRVSLDTKENAVNFEQELFDPIPENTVETLRYWTLVDSDADPNTGASESELQSLGVPPTNFKGSDLVVGSSVSGDQINTRVWYLRGDTFAELPAELYNSELVTNTVVDDVISEVGGPVGSAQEDLSRSVDVNNAVSTTINNEIAKIELNKPFNIQTISAQSSAPVEGFTSPVAPSSEGFTVADKLDKSEEESGIGVVLERPTIPVCLPRSDSRAGESVSIDIEGLLPDANIQGLFHPTGVGRTNETEGGRGGEGGGSIQSPVRSDAVLANMSRTQSLLEPVPVLSGRTNETGGGTVQLPVPSEATPGRHLVTIGLENTGLFVPCVVNVLPAGSHAQPTPQRDDSTRGGPGDTAPPRDDASTQGGPICPRVDLMKNDNITLEDVQFEWNAASQQCQPSDPSINIGQQGEYRIQNAECPNQMQWDRTARQCE